MKETILADLNQESSGENSADLAILEEMMKAGLSGGRGKAKTHPRMKPFIFTTRNGMEVIDLHQTLQFLNNALEFIKEKLTDKKNLLLVGTTPASKAAVEEFAKKHGCAYVTERWLGGILTNYKTLSKRISHFKKLKEGRSSGKFEKYTKKERLDIDREIEKLHTKFSGVENMEKLPEIVFVIDASHHMTAVKEAKILKIPVVAMISTDINPEIIDYPIPSNDRSKSAIEWVLGKLEEVIGKIKEKKIESK
ncbi:MAG: 30S ribosomal protein S2 [Candidatus Pacebacteria bacterium]|nr:30S ribosomal protein S2 [Candidatus Paceibacterota bacterium]